MSMIRFSLAMLGCIIFIAVSAPSPRAATCPGAAVVQAAADGFLSAAKSGTPAAFSAALARHANVDAVAIFALGKYRSDLPADRRGEYVRNAQRYMGKFLSNYGDRFKGLSLKIRSCKGNLVETTVTGGDDIVWRVSGGRVQDVKVSGFWLTIQLRKKFTDIIRQRNRRIEALLDFLERSG